jgi:hypothetical protein
MRTKLLWTTLALVVGASGARANPDPNPPTNIAGSDTMREITIDIINACNDPNPNDAVPGPVAGSLVYIGGGSSLGGQRMSAALYPPAGMQQVAPQSRFMNATECSSVATNRGQGVQVGLDGIAVFHDNTEFSACRVLRYAGCMKVLDLNDRAVLGFGSGAPGIDDGTGAGQIAQLALSDGPDTPGVLDYYCFTHWADALRIIYNGQHAHLDNSNPAAACNGNAPTASAIANKRCNSDVRRTLVETWANMFDTSVDDGVGGCTDVNCVRLRHAFRRDDFSGTTDTFLSLIGVPSLGSAFNVRTFCNGLENEDLDPVRRTCTTAAQATNDPVQVCAPLTFANRNVPFGTDGSPTGAAGACNYLTSPPSGANCAIPPTAATSTGDLGLVLAISLPTDLSLQYDTAFCTGAIGGAFKFAQAPAAVAPNAQRCPNGQGRLGGQCLAPVYSTGPKAGQFNCRLRRTNRAAGGAWSANYDARAHNLVPREALTGVIAQPNSTSITDPRWGGGGHYRINMALPEVSQTATPFGAAHPTCLLPDATRQIGCLVQADACSIGYAGLEAEDQDVGQDEIDVLGTNLPFALRVPVDSDPNDVTPSNDEEVEPRVVTIHRLVQPTGAACESGTGTFDTRYPLARVLWLNAAKGFGGFPGTLPSITNMVDSDPDINSIDPNSNGPASPDGTPDLLTRENEFASCYLDRTLVDPILEDHGYIPLPIPSVYPEANRFRQCP